jgi:hypothetical protein
MDILMKEKQLPWKAGVVRVQEPKSRFNIYLIIPSVKAFIDGGKLNVRKTLGFDGEMVRSLTTRHLGIHISYGRI